MFFFQKSSIFYTNIPILDPNRVIKSSNEIIIKLENIDVLFLKAKKIFFGEENALDKCIVETKCKNNAII